MDSRSARWRRAACLKDEHWRGQKRKPKPPAQDESCTGRSLSADFFGASPFPPIGFSSLEIPQVDRSDPALRQSHASRHLLCRGTLARLAHGVLETLAKRSLAWQQRHLLDFHPTCRVFHAIHLDVYRRLEQTPRQIPDHPLAAVVGVRELTTRTGTLQFSGCPACVGPTGPGSSFSRRSPARTGGIRAIEGFW